jgi:phage tail-like protein
MAWHLSNAWPKKLEGPTLNAEGNEVAIESLTISCEGLETE